MEQIILTLTTTHRNIFRLIFRKLFMAFTSMIDFCRLIIKLASRSFLVLQQIVRVRSAKAKPPRQPRLTKCRLTKTPRRSTRTRPSSQPLKQNHPLRYRPDHRRRTPLLARRPRLQLLAPPPTNPPLHHPQFRLRPSTRMLPRSPADGTARNTRDLTRAPKSQPNTNRTHPDHTTNFSPVFTLP